MKLIGILKSWWNAIPNGWGRNRAEFVPLRSAPAHGYSISGWTRAANGVYRNSSDPACSIFRNGRTWYRETPILTPGGGVELRAIPYPSLRAAIREERPTPGPATLFDEAAKAAKEPLFPCQHGEKVGLCLRCNED
jgi:hypothetical protein